MQDLESCEATRTGSIPAIRTNNSENAPLFWTRIGTITREIFYGINTGRKA